MFVFKSNFKRQEVHLWLQSKSKSQHYSPTQPENLRTSGSFNSQTCCCINAGGLTQDISMRDDVMWNDMTPEQGAILKKMSKHFQPNCWSTATTRSGIIIDNGLKKHVWGWIKKEKTNKQNPMLGLNKHASKLWSWAVICILDKYSFWNSWCWRLIQTAHKCPW